MVKRGEVRLAALDPTIGSEIQKTRPCLIISPPEIHDHMRIVMVAPMTSGGRVAAFRVPVTFRRVTESILPEQSRALNKQRLVKRLGTVSAAVLGQTLATLRAIEPPSPAPLLQTKRSVPLDLSCSDVPSTRSMRYIASMQDPANRFDITLPDDIARVLDRKVESGAYASPSDVLSDGLRALIDRDDAVERWLRDEVLEGHAEYLRDPSCAVPADDLLNQIKRRRAAQD